MPLGRVCTGSSGGSIWCLRSSTTSPSSGTPAPTSVIGTCPSGTSNSAASSGSAVSALHRFCFRYSRQQVLVAVKPYLLSHLLDRGFHRAAFLDADLLILGDLTLLLAPADDPAILLTPHLLTPLAGEARIARELNILQSGVYNAGFLGVSDSPTACRFLEWWQDRLYLHCQYALAEGMYYDQRWLDLVPAFFEDIGIVRDPRFNVAHWNLPERDVRSCRFFHFSGFSPDEPRTVTKYSHRLTMADLGPLFDRYAKLLEEAGYHESKSWPYAYDFFDNGVGIPGIARQMYRDLGDMVESFGNPFETVPPHSYFRWLNQSVGSNVTRLWEAVYRHRPDVQRAFPDILGADRDAFLDWTVRHGAGEYGIPDALRLPP